MPCVATGQCSYVRVAKVQHAVAIRHTTPRRISVATTRFINSVLVCLTILIQAFAADQNSTQDLMALYSNAARMVPMIQLSSPVCGERKLYQTTRSLHISRRTYTDMVIFTDSNRQFFWVLVLNVSLLLFIWGLIRILERRDIMLMMMIVIYLKMINKLEPPSNGGVIINVWLSGNWVMDLFSVYFLSMSSAEMINKVNLFKKDQLF